MASLFIAVIAAVAAIAAAALAWVASRRALRAGMTPVLVFTAPEEGNDWILENVGGGPALNLVVYDYGPSVWNKAVRCNPMRSGAEKDIPWAISPKELAATYEDALGGKYVSSCKGYLTRIKEKDRFFKCADSDLKIERRLRKELQA